MTHRPCAKRKTSLGSSLGAIAWTGSAFVGAEAFEHLHDLHSSDLLMVLDGNLHAWHALFSVLKSFEIRFLIQLVELIIWNAIDCICLRTVGLGLTAMD